MEAHLYVLKGVGHSVVNGESIFHVIGHALRTFDSEFYHRTLALFPAVFGAFERNLGPMVRLAFVGIYTVFVLSIPAIFLWLRWLERRDSW